MARESAGLVVYRRKDNRLEFLLAHPGGPFWKNKDVGAWTIPKGEIREGEDPLAAARREFKEELGLEIGGKPIELTPIKQKVGKLVRAWAVEGDFDVNNVKSNTFSMEWPPKSAQMVEFPEVDRVEYFNLETAKIKVNPAQIDLLEQVCFLQNRH
jgi:predicted NUDIX family NTP pyrophosphohydrolase